METVELAHLADECAGRWLNRLRLWGRQWRCSRCGATYAESPQVMAAISADYARIHLMERLAAEGHALLDGK